MNLAFELRPKPKDSTQQELSSIMSRKDFTPVDLSPDQKDLIMKIKAWYDSRQSPEIKFSGLAGTGKTTMIPYIAEQLGLKRTRIVSFTGRAITSCKQRTEETFKAMGINVEYSTIHAWLYDPVVNSKTGELIGWHIKDDIDLPSLVFVDEASMITKDIYADMMKLSDRVLFIFLGDHEQLPPVEAFKTGFHLMKKPDIILDKIHRQAAENPIIQLAHKARLGKFIQPGRYGDNVYVYGARVDVSAILPTSDASYEKLMVITDTNANRVFLNKLALVQTGHTQVELPGKSSVLLNIANYYGPVTSYNGDRLVIDSIISEITEDTLKCGLKFMDGKTMTMRIWRHLFHNGKFPPDKKYLFTKEEFKGNDKPMSVDFGYALTAHKAQGSQSNSVIVYGNGMCFREDRRKWLYVAISRAEQKLVIIP